MLRLVFTHDISCVISLARGSQSSDAAHRKSSRFTPAWGFPPWPPYGSTLFLPYTRYGIFLADAPKDATGARALPCHKGNAPPLDSPFRACRHGEGRCPSAINAPHIRAVHLSLPRAARLRTIGRRCHAYAMTPAAGSIDAPHYSGGSAPPNPAPGDAVPWTPVYLRGGIQR